MPIDDDERIRTAASAQSFVLRCRLEQFSGSEVRRHFVLEEVGRDTVWRFNDIEPLVETLRMRIALVMSGSTPPFSET